MKLWMICAASIGTLALAGGGIWYGLQGAAAPVKPVMAARADPLPLGGNWHSVDQFIKQQTAIAEHVEDMDQAAMRTARQAELRRRLQPPLLPLTLVADYEAKSSPRSHWGDGADTSLTGSRPSPRNPLPATQASAQPSGDAPAAVAKTDSLVSDRARETVAMLEAFKAALQHTGGAENFKAAAVAVPYVER